jgi:HSP20 family protein
VNRALKRRSQTNEEKVIMNIIRRNEPKHIAPTSTEWSPFGMLREFMRWDPFREMAPLLPQSGREILFVPDIDIKETPDAYVFRADLPGIAEKDLEISLTGNRLTLSGKREEERREEKDTYFACERSYGSFSRTFTLPAGTDAEHAKADLKDGVLTVSVPKKPEVQAKKIPVQAGERKN